MNQIKENTLQELQSTYALLGKDYVSTQNAVNSLLGYLKENDCPPDFEDIADAWKEHDRLADHLADCDRQLNELEIQMSMATGPVKFYFTYGTEGQPFHGGWTEVIAPTRKAACKIFRIYHPDKTAGLLNCSSVYAAQEFERTSMYASDNLGARCHEVIQLTCEPTVKEVPHA